MGIRGKSSCITPSVAGGLQLAEPSIVVDPQGVDATFGVSVITAAGVGDTTTDNIGNSVFVDESTGPFASPAGGWSVDSSSANPATFTNTSAGATAEPTKVSGDGTVMGTAGIDAAAEVAVLNFDGATGGQFSINECEPINWDDDAMSVQNKLIAVGYGCTVSGSDGSFTVTADSTGERPDLTITENFLTK